MKEQDLRNLKKRYLVWLYKTTKETLDKTERKFTQLEIDKFILKELRKYNKASRLKKFILEWQQYLQNKEKDGIFLKFSGNHLKPDYQFLLLKLKAVEKAIVKELGRSSLSKIKDLYEEQMLKRILEEREEKR